MEEGAQAGEMVALKEVGARVAATEATRAAAAVVLTAEAARTEVGTGQMPCDEHCSPWFPSSGWRWLHRCTECSDHYQP